MSRKYLKEATGGPRRASGEGGNSRRFATIQMPDGRIAKVPAAKDAATYLCMVQPDGNWPTKATLVLLYDAVWLVTGSVFELEEMRPGHGMGTLKTVRVIDTRARIQQYEGTYGQVQRWLLCEETISGDGADALSPTDLLGGH